MVTPTPDSSSLPHPNTTTAEDDALKRNTDCVYYLASPLTCKKGSDCEYRHSEYARVNPRDCWYWLNGNCMNPKCAFRHPPLDGLLGTQAAGPMGVLIPPAQQSSLPPTPLAYNDSGKQDVPCIFFQKGYCMKGDRCAFLHEIIPSGIKTFQSQGAGPSAVNSFPNKALPPSRGAGPSAVSSFPSKTIGALQKCSQDTLKGTLNFSKPTPTPVATKLPVAKVETVFSGNVFNLEEDATPPRVTDGGFSTYRPPTTALANGSLLSRTSRVQQCNIANDYDTCKEKMANEFLKESSPGFDVLVEDELEEPDYYHDDDQFARSVGHEGKHVSSMEEYDLDPTEEYGAMSELDRHERNQREYGWAQHCDSFACGDGRVFSKGRSTDRVGESDLRYRLSKQRRVDGLRSVVSNDFVSQSHVEDHGNRVPVHSCEGSASSRLKGRIKFPGRSDAASEGNMYREWELDPRGRHLSGRMYQGGKFRERLRGRVMDGYNGGGRDFSCGCRVRSESVDDNGMDFAGPKSLAELKGTEAPWKALQSSITIGVESSFEGTKPLSVLLKKKRETEDVVDKLTDSSLTKTAIPLDGHEQSESGAVNAPFDHTEDVGNDDGAIMEDGYEDPEIYGDDLEGGEYCEEQGEEGYYNYDENENVDIIAEGEEYLDCDDSGGDFAKKVGVMFS